MEVYKAPLDEYRYLLDLFGYEELAKELGYEDYDQETFMALIEQGAAFAIGEMMPLNKSGDREGLTFDPKTGSVTTPKGFKELWKKFCEGGYPMLTHKPEFGGAGAPHCISVPFNEFFVATNKSFTMCPGLTHGLIEALEHYGTEELQQKYIPKLVSGEWTGTMCLTEPQCGTDLGLLTTKAEPEGDHYKLTGTKIWITFGEHDWTDNIIHLVLARLPGAPEGSKGISVFAVPKFLDDGSHNNISCGGLEHKMGIHASPTCVMNLDGSVGYLIGDPHKGMRAMFVMMNAARLFVGMEGIGLGDVAYQTAVAFAKDRKQSRALDPAKRDPNAKADNILVHPDVRRMLLNIKATTDAMRALALWVGTLIDVSNHHPDDDKRAWAGRIVALLTPVVKSYSTERGFWNISEAMQVTGGAGYTQDWPIEQYMRDARISLIYEGTNAIQALDLVGRKLASDGGETYKEYGKYIAMFLKEHADNAAFQEFAEPMKKALNTLNEVTMNMGMKGMQDPEEVGAAASNYLNLFGTVTMAFMWARMIAASLGQEGEDHKKRVKTGRYFFQHVLPEMDTLVAKVNAGKDAMMAFDAEEF